MELNLALQMWETVVTFGLSERHLAVRPGSITGSRSNLLKPILDVEMSFSAFSVEGGDWSCPNKMCQASLTSLRIPYLLRRVDGICSGRVGGGVGGRVRVELWMDCKIKLQIKKEKKIVIKAKLKARKHLLQKTATTNIWVYVYNNKEINV